MSHLITSSNKIAIATFAVLMAFGINGSMLVGFDRMASAADQSAQNAAVASVNLPTVTVVAHRS